MTEVRIEKIPQNCGLENIVTPARIELTSKV